MEGVRLARRFDKIVDEGPKLRRCLQAVEKVAPSDVTVLILEEAGTGGELVTQARHDLSGRNNKPMMEVRGRRVKLAISAPDQLKIRQETASAVADECNQSEPARLSDNLKAR